MILATVSHWSCRDSIVETNLTWEVRERVTDSLCLSAEFSPVEDKEVARGGGGYSFE